MALAVVKLSAKSVTKYKGSRLISSGVSTLVVTRLRCSGTHTASSKVGTWNKILPFERRALDLRKLKPN